MTSALRKPFAPLDGSRLQSLTSTKNRQNAILSSTVKRKASESSINDDSENVDPTFSSKRPKGGDGVFLVKAGLKTRISAAPKLQPSLCRPASSCQPASQSRAVLKPKAPSTKAYMNSTRRSMSIIAGTDLYARGTGRGGILQTKRRSSTPFVRREPSTKLASSVPFSIDAALKGTLSAYASVSPAPVPASPVLPLGETPMEASWFFSIHEDTPEQEMTNLLQHSTCVLDISSDEESERKARHEKAEGRDKENIPPANDASQRSPSQLEAADGMLMDKTRNPLSQLNATDFYEAGCDETSIVLVSCDDLGEDSAESGLSDQNGLSQRNVAPAPGLFTVAESTVESADASVEEIMACRVEQAGVAAVLEPIEGTGQTFDLWESGSSKEDDLTSTLPQTNDKVKVCS